VSRGTQHSAAKRRKEKERQAKQAAKRERRLHKPEGEAPAEGNDALVREYLGLPVEPEDEAGDEAEGEPGTPSEGTDPSEGKPQ
jgi:hypothetical protein